jgi:3-oxoacyl-(acyl-carrier-protein) synthase
MTPRHVTGLGIACALGTGAEAFFRGLADARRLSALPPSAIISFDASKYPDARIVEVPDFDPTRYLGDKGLRTLDRLTKLLVVASREGKTSGLSSGA